MHDRRRLRDQDPALAAQFAYTVEARSALLNSSALLLPPPATARLRHQARPAGRRTRTGHVELWRTAAGSPSVDTGQQLPLGKGIAAIALSRDGTLLAASEATATLSLWHRTPRPGPIGLSGAQMANLRAPAFSRDGRLLAASSSDGTHLVLARCGTCAGLVYARRRCSLRRGLKLGSDEPCRVAAMAPADA